MKFIKKLVLFIMLIFCMIFVNSCEFPEPEDHLGPETFDDFSMSVFTTLIGSDELTCNFLFKNREDFGLESYEPSLYVPSGTSILGMILVNLYFGRVKLYDYDLLNEDQKMTYNLINDLLIYINSKSGDMTYLDNNYLGTYLGYQAQLPLLLSEYNFRNEQDIINYLTYLSLIPETFKGYYDFEIVKAEKGYGMPNYVIDNVVSQCETFSSSVLDGSCFLYKVMNDKIDDVDFLNEDQKSYYKSENVRLVSTSLFEGYDYIKNNLPSLYNLGTNDYGLCYYYTSDGEDVGRKYYELIFKKAVGYDITVEEAIDYIDSKIETYNDELVDLSSKLSKEEKDLIISINNDTYQLMTCSPLEQIYKHIDNMKASFPSLDVIPEIEISEIDESMSDNFSPAAYMTSPIDEMTTEHIYLNPVSIYLYDEMGEKIGYDGNYLYTTLAHEGLPGHLYQNVYFKSLDVNPIRKVLSCSGYTEGWATYIENYSYNFLRDELGDNVVDYLIAASKRKAAIYSRIDFGIHYNGWKEEELYNFLKDYSNVASTNDVIPILQQLAEIPTNYQKYFFTYLKFVDMYDMVKNHLGDNFNEIEFHETILSLGSVSLKYVEDALNAKYMNENI